MFFSLFVRECDCSHKMIIKEIIYCSVNAFRAVTRIDNTAALPHKFLFPDLQRARPLSGCFKLNPTVPGRVRKHDKPIGGARNARPCAFATDSVQCLYASLEVSRVDSFRGHIIKNGRNPGRLH